MALGLQGDAQNYPKCRKLTFLFGNGRWRLVARDHKKYAPGGRPTRWPDHQWLLGSLVASRQEMDNQFPATPPEGSCQKFLPKTCPKPGLPRVNAVAHGPTPLLTSKCVRIRVKNGLGLTHRICPSAAKSANGEGSAQIPGKM